MKRYRINENVDVRALLGMNGGKGKKESLLEEEKRRRQIPIADFTRGGEILIVRVVEGMQKAKDNLSMIVYGGQAVNPETEERLQEMHRDICSMLDELPW